MRGLSRRARERGLNRGRGLVLPVVLLLVLVSASLRLPGLGAALAGAGAGTDPGARIVSAASLPGTCMDQEALALLLADLDAREARLAREEMAARARAHLLTEGETRLRDERLALEAAEARLSALLALADSAAERDVARLTAIYETMRPRQAAALFETMPPPIAAGFLGGMRTDPAAAILAQMEPARAREVSLALAARNARAPRD